MCHFVEKYLDQDAFAALNGGLEVSQELIKQQLDIICYTGSPMVGRIIAAEAGKNLVPCILELGGKCPLIIDHTADLEYAASRTAATKFGNAGQTCIAPDYAIVHKSVSKEYIEKVQQKIASQFNGKCDGLMINVRHAKRVQDLIATSEGEIICGGNCKVDERVVEPTLIMNPSLQSTLMTDEIFGPVLPIFEYEQLSDALEIVNSLDKPLAVYYFGKHNGENVQTLKRETHSGALVVNECVNQIACSYAGFGGVGVSG